MQVVGSTSHVGEGKGIRWPIPHHVPSMLDASFCGSVYGLASLGGPSNMKKG